MCKDCGCSLPKEQKNESLHEHAVSNKHHHHHHDDGGAHEHEHHHHHEGVHANPQLNDAKTIAVISKILDANDKEAAANLEHFDSHGILAVNLMSAPGSGKTTLLEKTAERLKLRMGVIEGDLETNRDAERIKAKGVPAVQISTGTACHLDAHMVHHGIHELPLENLDIVFIENVGNLVCPASYAVGSHINVVLLSTPEGCDKVAKYPTMFKAADLVLITKMDLAPHFDFDISLVKSDLRRLNPKAEIIEISTKDEASLAKWIGYLEFKKNMRG